MSTILWHGEQLDIVNSLVDYLKYKGIDSSFASRKTLAEKYGIKNYTGSADQNKKLLSMLKSGPPPAQTSPVVKKTTSTPVKSTTGIAPVTTSVDQRAVVTPQGVIYKWTKDQTEFQLFPENYFAGADVKIYFGDVFVDDIVGISFALQEQVKPIYSYGSRTYKEVARGNRLVTGRFYLVFKEAGYISAIFDHIGQLGQKNAQNTLVAIMAGDTRSEWHGTVLQTWESLVNEYWKDPTNDANKPIDGTMGEVERRLSYYEKEIWGRNSSADINHANQTYFYTSRRDANYQPQSFADSGFDIFITYGPIEQALLADSQLKSVSFNTTVKAIRQVQILSESQEIMGDGTVIQVFDFLAKDLD